MFSQLNDRISSLEDNVAMLHSSILELKEENTRLKDQIAQMHTYPATPAAKAATPAALKAGTTVVTRASAAKAVPKKADSSSGFVKPSVISDELIEFLGKETGTMMSRVEVTKEISAYITANQLKDRVSGRQIYPDAKLAKLLKVGKDEVLTYFNLHRYLNAHFIKR